MNIIKRLIRMLHMPKYAIFIFIKTLQLWGIRNGLLFWLTKEKEQIVKIGDLSFAIRSSNLSVKTSDIMLVLECASFGNYDAPGFSIKDTDTIIDIGGHVGSFSIVASKKATRGIIHVIEPVPDNYVQINKNIELNHSSNIIAHNNAIASSNRTVQIYLNNINTGAHSAYKRSNNFIDAAGISLKDFMHKNNIKKCNLMKMDCEGAEYEILFNCDKETLLSIEKMAFEYHEPEYLYDKMDREFTPLRLIQFLQSNNFSVSTKELNQFAGIIYAIQRK